MNDNSYERNLRRKEQNPYVQGSFITIQDEGNRPDLSLHMNGQSRFKNNQNVLNKYDDNDNIINGENLVKQIYPYKKQSSLFTDSNDSIQYEVDSQSGKVIPQQYRKRKTNQNYIINSQRFDSQNQPSYSLEPQYIRQSEQIPNNTYYNNSHPIVQNEVDTNPFSIPRGSPPKQFQMNPIPTQTSSNNPYYTNKNNEKQVRFSFSANKNAIDKNIIAADANHSTVNFKTMRQYNQPGIEESHQSYGQVMNPSKNFIGYAEKQMQNITGEFNTQSNQIVKPQLDLQKEVQKYSFNLADQDLNMVNMKSKAMKKHFSNIKEKYYFEKDDEKFFTIPNSELQRLTTLEKQLYYQQKVILVRKAEPEEKYSCGIYMMNTNYYMLSLNQGWDNKENNPLDNVILNFKQESDAIERLCCLSSMKSSKTDIQYKQDPQFDAQLIKRNITASPYCGKQQTYDLIINLKRNYLIDKVGHFKGNMSHLQELDVENQMQATIIVRRFPIMRASILCGPFECDPKYELTFSAGTPHLMIGSLCKNLYIQIRDLNINKCTGLITRSFTSCSNDFCSNGSQYSIEFPRSASPIDKLVILASLEVIDQCFFNKRFPPSSFKGLLCCFIPF